MPERLPVLLVDDDRQMLQTLSDILTLRGYAPCTAPSGREGLAQAGRMATPLAIAVVDLRLPDMDGIELIGHLHAMSDHTEVVVLTGNASVESAVLALREHSFDYLTKPVEPERLLDTLDRARERWLRKRAESALGKSEERLRSMFQAIGDAVFVTDHGGQILEVNPAALRLTGFSLEELRARRLGDLLRPREPGQRSGPGEAPGSSMPTVEELSFGEFVLTTREGESRVTEMRSSAFDPDRYVHTARDLSDRLRLESQLHRSQRMEAVGQLAGGLAHDFNNVLTAITGYAHLLTLDLEGDPELLQDVRGIIRASGRAARLTRQLLTFSRRQVVTPQVLSVNAVIQGMEGMLRHLVRENVELRIRLSPQAGNVLADAGQLEQILVNLVVNAGDAMPEGGRLSISTAPRDFDRPPSNLPDLLPGPYVALRVEDTGVGMDAATMGRIFEPFFTTKEDGKGTGLGLATVYGIATQSGGRVDVRSQPGQGTRFTVLLPRVGGEAGAPPARDSPSLEQLVGSETVLVVEDDHPLRSVMVRSLERYGYRVLEARGDDALRLAREHAGPIHVVLVDVVLPGLGGGEVAIRVNDLHPRARFIMTSGHSPEQTAAPRLPERATFLGKPFTTEELLRKIRDVLDHPHP